MLSQKLLSNFLQAMRHVYRFPSPGDKSLARWKPGPIVDGHHGRYLWTDAFGVLNFITLSRLDPPHAHHYLELAKILVKEVHETLGRTRDLQDLLPGATNEHPLSGGLRIGKLDAHGPDCDGQYHHYLTLWMFALNRLSIATMTREYNDHAIDLAKAIHPKFVFNNRNERPRMYWKISVDMSRPLVRSEGNLDPLDGYLVFSLLQLTDDSDVLKSEISEYRRIVETKWRDYSSNDTLDLGMTIWSGHWYDGEENWATGLVQRAKGDLKILFDPEGGRYLKRPLKKRLAFREFGTCLGIGASKDEELIDLKDKLLKAWEWDNRVPIPRSAGEKLESIDLVMYAAALFPGAFQKGFL